MRYLNNSIALSNSFSFLLSIAISDKTPAFGTTVKPYPVDSFSKWDLISGILNFFLSALIVHSEKKYSKALLRVINGKCPAFANEETDWPFIIYYRIIFPGTIIPIR
jgi:hypothetical protein